MGYCEIGYCVATLLYICILLSPFVGVIRRRFLKSYFLQETVIYELLECMEKGDLGKNSISEASLVYVFLHIVLGGFVSAVCICFYPIVLAYILVSIIIKNKLNKNK